MSRLKTLSCMNGTLETIPILSACESRPTQMISLTELSNDFTVTTNIPIFE